MKQLKKYISFLLDFSLIIAISTNVHAVSDSEYEMAIVVYGEQLSDAEQEEVKELLGVTDPDDVKEYIITGQDYANYIDGNPDSRMFSSAKIVRKEEGYGIRIKIVTPENITKV